MDAINEEYSFYCARHEISIARLVELEKMCELEEFKELKQYFQVNYTN